MRRKKIDKVKRNKDMLLIQLMLKATTRGISMDEALKEYEENKKKIGLAS